MKKLIVIALALSLTACSGLGQGIQSTGKAICEHEFETRAALGLALERATTIQNPSAREAALAAIRVSLAALDACPQGGAL